MPSLVGTNDSEVLETILTEIEPFLSGEEEDDDAGPSSDMPVGTVSSVV